MHRGKSCKLLVGKLRKSEKLMNHVVREDFKNCRYVRLLYWLSLFDFWSLMTHVYSPFNASFTYNDDSPFNYDVTLTGQLHLGNFN